jgi:hypothetical protein
MMRDGRVAKGLALFGIGLGLAELLAPRWLGRLVGTRGRRTRLMRAFGLREIAAGALILAGRPLFGLWARTAGDALDLAALGLAARRSRRRGRVGAALAAVLGAGALDLLYARRLGARADQYRLTAGQTA